MFRVGKSNVWVKAGDVVWTDEMVAEFSGLQHMHTAPPVVRAVPVSGTVRHDGTVVLAGGRLVPLDQCRPCEKVIRL